MKNAAQFWGIIALAAVIGFGVAGCEQPTDTAGHTHDWGEWDVTLAATCIATGSQTRTCALDATHTETEVILIDTVNGHDWDYDNATETTAPTCLTKGSGTTSCKRDGCNETNTGTDNIPALGHDFTGTWTQKTPPTCIVAGVDETTCTREDCTEKSTRTGAAALGHDWETETTTTPATATTDGVEGQVCKNDPSHTQGTVLYATGTTGLEFVLITSGNNANTYRVSRGTATGAIHIPAYHRPNASSPYLPVTEISNGTNSSSNNAFGGTSSSPNTTVTSVTFSANSQLKIINSYAFSYCTSLTSINIPVGVTEIGSSAFNYCTSLTSVTIPASVTEIGYSAFIYCTSLTSVTIPANVTDIRANAFANCANLASITVAANNPNYASQDGILYNKAKTEFIQVPRRISGNVTIPAGITVINHFGGCTSLTGITFATGTQLATIGDGAFYNTSLTSITIPASVKSIVSSTSSYYGAFKDCTSLASVTFAAGSQLATIGENAFNGCASLTSITLPASVTSVCFS